MSVSQLVALMWICVMWMRLYDISVVCRKLLMRALLWYKLDTCVVHGSWGVKLQARVCIVVAVLLFRCAKAAVIQPSVQQYTVDWEIFVAINFHGSFELQNFFSG